MSQLNANPYTQATGAPPAEPQRTLREETRATTCSVCGAAKKTRLAFCKRDWLALPMRLRLPLADPKRAEETFPRALAFLRDLAEYRKDLPARAIAGQWSFRDEDELLAAGWICAGHGQCPAPTCNRSLVFWVSPDRSRTMGIELRDYQPHKPRCPDPDYSARMRAIKKQRRDARRAATLAARRRAKS